MMQRASGAREASSHYEADRRTCWGTNGRAERKATIVARESHAQRSGADVLAQQGDVAFAERRATMVEIHAPDVLAGRGETPALFRWELRDSGCRSACGSAAREGVRSLASVPKRARFGGGVHN